jgi:hypothetical protein
MATLMLDYSQVYIFNTHFYTKLVEEDTKMRYHDVQKWTKNVDIFSFKYIFIPIHLISSEHWTLVIIDFERKSVIYVDSLKVKISEEDIKICNNAVRFAFLYYYAYIYKRLIIALLCNRSSLSLLYYRYLEMEFKAKKGNTSEFDLLEELLNKQPSLAKLNVQENSYDCGVYVCTYAYMYTARRPEVSIEFNIEDLKSARKNIALRIINGSAPKTTADSYYKVVLPPSTVPQKYKRLLKLPPMNSFTSLFMNSNEFQTEDIIYSGPLTEIVLATNRILGRLLCIY